MSEELAEAGSPMRVELIAPELERPYVGLTATGHDVGEPCANCGTVRRGPYCHECGQAGHVHRTAAALVHDIAHGVFHFEGKIWHTLPLLAFRPGDLTRRYVLGERAKFVSPMALFLFSVFLMFAVVSDLARPVQIQSPSEAKIVIAKERATLTAQLGALESTGSTVHAAAARQTLARKIEDTRRRLGALAAVERGLRLTQPGSVGASPALSMNSGWRWLDEGLSRAASNPELLLYKMKSYGYKYSWALIPISLPFLWLLFALRRDVGFYDHAIFATYSLSFMSLGVVALTVLGWIGLPNVPLVLVGLLVPPVHMYRQLRGAYGLTWIGAGWRTAALLLIVTVTSTLYVALLFYLGSE